MPIRLSPTPTKSGVLPLSRVELGVGRCGDAASDAEKGAEGVERVEPSVEAESEFVEVGLEMLVADAVMNATQPGLEVGKDEMDHRQILLGHLGIAPLGDSEVFVAALAEADVATPVVSNDLRSRRNGALNEAAERLGAAIGHDGKPDTPSVTARLAFFEFWCLVCACGLRQRL